MSKSIHENYSMLKGLSKDQIEAQEVDPDSVLRRISKKKLLKKEVRSKRKETKILSEKIHFDKQRMNGDTSE